jgi:Uma2 family endonuclease
VILDPSRAENYLDERKELGLDQWDEVWDGVTVVPPMPNNEHYNLAFRLCSAFSDVIDWDRGDVTVPGGNVSDIAGKGWEKKNYRCPDAIVHLAGGIAKDIGTHWYMGPDFLVEIISPGEEPHAKFDFYAKVKTRELLIVDRDPWALELFHLHRGKMRSAGRSTLVKPAVIASAVLPLTFTLQKGKKRPTILVTHTATGQTWTA